MATVIEDLFTPAEVAKKLNIAKSTVYAMAHRGLIPAIKIGKCLRIRPAALIDFLHRQEKIAGLKSPNKAGHGLDL